MTTRDDPWEIARRVYGGILSIRRPEDVHLAERTWAAWSPEARSLALAHLAFLALGEVRALRRDIGRLRQDVGEGLEAVLDDLAGVADALEASPGGRAPEAPPPEPEPEPEPPAAEVAAEPATRGKGRKRSSVEVQRADKVRDGIEDVG